MLKCTLQRNVERQLNMANELKVGEMAEIMGEAYTGHIVLRTYSQLISLTDPGSVWSSPSCVDLPIRRLSRGEVVTLKVE